MGGRWSWRGLALASLVVVGIVIVGWARRRPSADEVWKQAQVDLQAGRFEQAQSAIEQLASLRPATPLDHMLFAQVAIAENQPDQALEELAMVPDEHYMASQARLLSGQIEIRRKRLRLAETWLKKALAIDPDLVQAYRELIFIHGLQLRRAELNTEFRGLQRLAGLSFDNIHHWCLLRNNSWEPGLIVERLLPYLAADPLDRWSRLALAENFRRMGFYLEAESTLEPLPLDDHEGAVIRIQIALDRHELEAAKEGLARGSPDDPDLARLRGRMFLAQGDAGKAEPFFRLAYMADPDNRDTILGYAVALDALGRGKEAAVIRERGHHLDRLITLILRADNPKGDQDAPLLRELASACESLDRYEEALAWLRLVIGLDPLDPHSQRRIFRIQRAIKDQRGNRRAS